MKNIPLALYIHFPWCVRKCPYCDFNSHSIKNIPEDQYIAALLQDLRQDLAFVQNRSLTSIFLGGGTPSLFSPQAIGKLLNETQKLINFETNIEITLEANPGTFNSKKIKSLYGMGIDRLSIGIQSFQDKKLQALGRIHSAANAKHAVEMARYAGFDNFNLDLMHGLPGQTVKDALSDLKTALSFNPKHISWYQLTIEPETYFADHPPQIPNENLLLKIQEEGNEFLTENYFNHYEVSAYCKKNFRCKHNMNYWQFGDYIGIGAGAHSKITNLKTNVITRYEKFKDPNDYLNCTSSFPRRRESRTFVSKHNIVTKKDLPLEFMMNALRVINGVPKKLFQERTGLKIKDINKYLKKAQQQGFLIDDDSLFKLTPHGQKFLNKCLEIFVG